MDEYEELLYLVRLTVIIIACAGIATVFAFKTPQLGDTNSLRADVVAATIANQPYITPQGVDTQLLRSAGNTDVLTYQGSEVYELGARVQAGGEEKIYNPPGYLLVDEAGAFGNKQTKRWSVPTAVDGVAGTVVIEVLYEPDE